MPTRSASTSIGHLLVASMAQTTSGTTWKSTVELGTPKSWNVLQRQPVSSDRDCPLSIVGTYWPVAGWTSSKARIEDGPFGGIRPVTANGVAEHHVSNRWKALPQPGERGAGLVPRPEIVSQQETRDEVDVGEAGSNSSVVTSRLRMATRSPTFASAAWARPAATLCGAISSLIP